MRSISRNTLLFSLLLASVPALADTTRTESARLQWRDNNHHLVVEANQGIVRATTTEPASYFGVRSGDRILRIDGRPVRRIDDLTDVLARTSRSRLPVTVLRRGNETTLDIDTAAWRQVLSAEPAAAPQPPAAPRPQG